jgi:cob(I)alamin adenosyltransferase
MLKTGLIQVYTSNSNQINFATFGLALRASGHNLRTLITCFESFELLDGINIASTFLDSMVIDNSAIEKTNIEEKVIKDKVLIPFINQDLIGLKDILKLINEKPNNVELVLSGSGAPKDIIKEADLVTEMVVKSHIHTSKKESFPEDQDTIEVITGNGKGKTTYCLGKAMLTSCLGTRSRILQFIKSPKPYGEVKAIKRFPLLEISSMGEGFLDLHSNSSKKKHVDAARRAWKECLKEIFSLKYGLVVLDEIDNAIHYGLVNPERVREMLFLKPEKLNLILSGRNAHSEVMDAATTVIEMKEIKHPFTKGIKARMGIEF